MSRPEPRTVLIVLFIKIAAYFLLGSGIVLVILGALQHFYLRTTVPVMFPGRATTVGLFCMMLGCVFVVFGIIVAVWLRVVEKRWRKDGNEVEAKGKGVE